MDIPEIKAALSRAQESLKAAKAAEWYRQIPGLQREVRSLSMDLMEIIEEKFVC